MISLISTLGTYHSKASLFIKTLINVSKNNIYISNKKTTFINN